jgi:hypothetical protein
MDLIKERSIVIMAEQGSEGKVQYIMENLGGVVNNLKNSHGHPMGNYLSRDLKVRGEHVNHPRNDFLVINGGGEVSMGEFFLGLPKDILEDCMVCSVSGSFFLDRGFLVASFMHSMILKVTSSFLNSYVPSLVVNCLAPNSSGAILLVDNGFSGDFSVRGKVWPAFSSLSSLSAQLMDILGNRSTMDTWDNEWHHYEEMVETDFEKRQCLVIQINSLSSTISFTLDTLVQHRVMVGMIHDEVDYLRSQIESLYLQLAQREAHHGNSHPDKSNGGMAA